MQSYETLLKKISLDKVARITGSRRELEAAAIRICGAAKAKSINVVTQNHDDGALYIWRRPWTVRFTSKNTLLFIRK